MVKYKQVFFDILRRCVMKHRFLLITLVLVMISCLTACKHYEQEDADRITAKGTEMMQAWLDENMPDAEITECSAFINNITYSSREYLFDYATGRIVLNGEEAVFAIDTVTGDVYFENDQSVEEKLNEIAADFLYETMGITPEGGDCSFECHVLAPFRNENHEVKAYEFDYGFDFGLPAGVEDLEAFVRNPASRPLLYVQANITLSDETDLAAYDFAVFEKLSEECGMLFGSIHIDNSTQISQRKTRDWVTKASFYEDGCWIERDGVYITGRVRVREEERNDLTGEMTVSDRRFAPQQDLVFEKTETGYRYYLPNEDWQEVFYIRASVGAEMLEYNYIEYSYSDVAGFIAGEYGSDEKDGTELIWRKQPNGDYVLSLKAQDRPITFSHAGKLERAE